MVSLLLRHLLTLLLVVGWLGLFFEVFRCWCAVEEIGVHLVFLRGLRKRSALILPSWPCVWTTHRLIQSSFDTHKADICLVPLPFPFSRATAVRDMMIGWVIFAPPPNYTRSKDSLLKRRSRAARRLGMRKRDPLCTRVSGCGRTCFFSSCLTLIH